MIIKKKGEFVQVIPLHGLNFAIEYDQKQQINLLPGANEVPDEVWKACKERFPVLSDLLASGELTEMPIKVETPAKGKDSTETIEPQTTTFAKLSQKDKKALIVDTVSIETLEKWLEDEKSEEIRKALEEKILEVKNYDPSRK